MQNPLPVLPTMHIAHAYLAMLPPRHMPLHRSLSWASQSLTLWKVTCHHFLLVVSPSKLGQLCTSGQILETQTAKYGNILFYSIHLFCNI